MIERQYRSLAEMVAEVRKLPVKAQAGAGEWYGGTLEEALWHAEHGWQEGLRKASALAQRIAERVVQSPIPAMVEAIEYDVFGGAYDPGAIAIGQPEAWGIVRPSPQRREVRIVHTINASGGVPAQMIMTRGIAAMALALALQSQGYSITMDVVESDRPAYGGSGKVRSTIVRVADAGSGSPLDLDRMAFCLAHPGMFRHLFASAIDGFIGSHSNTRWGSSQPADDNELAAQAHVYIGCAHWSDTARWADGGEKWVMEQFHKQTKKEA